MWNFFSSTIFSALLSGLAVQIGMDSEKGTRVQPIGHMQTCFQEKFGVPRQSLMVGSAKGILKLNPDPQFKDALKYLDGFSHVWIVFLFHQHEKQVWRPLITPPRIDAPGRVGVFASRSPHRPNPIGLSAVKLEKIDFNAKGGIEIHVSGVDLLDGTPVLDIKPYLPYVDCITDAKGGWTETAIPKYPVVFSEKCLEQMKEFRQRHPRFQEDELKLFIEFSNRLLQLPWRKLLERYLLYMSFLCV